MIGVRFMSLNLTSNTDPSKLTSTISREPQVLPVRPLSAPGIQNTPWSTLQDKRPSSGPMPQWDCCKTPRSRHSSQHYRSLLSVSEDNVGETKRRNRYFATVPQSQKRSIPSSGTGDAATKTGPRVLNVTRDCCKTG